MLIELVRRYRIKMAGNRMFSFFYKINFRAKFLSVLFFRLLWKKYLVSRDFLSLECLKNQLISGKSIIRIGDGEIAIIYGKSISFQDYHEDIRNSLLSAIIKYNNGSRYIIGLPKKYLSMTNDELRIVRMLRLWLPLKVMVECFFPEDTPYVDAHLFYYPGSFVEAVVPAIANRPVIFVTNAKCRQMLMDRPPQCFPSLRIVVAREKNAFDEIDLLRKDLSAAIEDASVLGRPVVICSCGPAGKVLAIECSQLEVQAIDLGAGIEVVLTDACIEERI